MNIKKLEPPNQVNQEALGLLTIWLIYFLTIDFIKVNGSDRS